MKRGETSYKETAFGIIPRSKLVELEIQGIKKAWDFLLEKNLQGRIEISPQFLKELHQIAFGWIFPDLAGGFRQFEVTVSHHIPPKSYMLSQSMTDFSRDLALRQKNLPKVIDLVFLDELIDLLAWTHHKFLWIHPFFDYNGRIGRLLMSLVLMNFNLPPIELKVETVKGRISYINALKRADNGSLDDLKKLIKEALTEAVTKLN